MYTYGVCKMSGCKDHKAAPKNDDHFGYTDTFKTSISKTKKPIPNRKMPFFCILKGLLNN